MLMSYAAKTILPHHIYRIHDLFKLPMEELGDQADQDPVKLTLALVDTEGTVTYHYFYKGLHPPMTELTPPTSAGQPTQDTLHQHEPSEM